MPRLTEPARRRPALITLLAAAALLASQVPARAADEPAPLVDFELPAADLGATLLAIGRQGRTSVAFDPGTLAGQRAPALSGRMTVEQAVTRAVAGSGLVVVMLPGGGIVVRPATLGAPPAGSGAPARSEPADSADPGAPTAPPQEIGRVEITGSRLKRIDAEGPLPVQVYRKEEIERSGQPNLTRFLGSLNEVSMSSGEGSASVTAGQGTVQLRGLPVGSTAVLLNGRKLQGAGNANAGYFNLSLIPLAAIDRVEVVPVGSSAVYGGDALAGVVNIILRSDLDGAALDARLGAGKGFGDGSLSFATGRRGAEGSFMLLGAYSKAIPLNMAERGFFLDGDYRRFGGADTRVMTCAPGTVSSTTAANLPGLGSTTAGIPVSPGQPLTVASFAATAGRPNLCSDAMNGNGNSLVYGNENLGMHATAERRLGEMWTAFGELTLSDDRLSGSFSGMKLNNVTVPASNAHNPFGVPVRVTSTLGLENGNVGLSRDTRYTRLLGGLRGELAARWDAEFSVSTSRDRSEQRNLNVNVDAAARTAALASTDPATAFNPFTGARAATDDVLRSIWSDSVRYSEGRKDLAAAFVRGPVMRLPAGELHAVIGAEAARDYYDSVTVGIQTTSGTRSAQAAYGELRAPLLRRAGAGGRGGELAALTVAARVDRYSQFGSAGTYQGGLEVRPTDAWLLRASAATSFKPPTLAHQLVTDTVIPPQALVVVDPARNNEPITTADALRTANPALRPERGKALAFGASWEPGSGLQLGATAWRVRIDQMIALLSPQATLNSEAFLPGFVTREPSMNGMPGRVTRLLQTESNLGYLASSGVDLEAQGRWRTALGQWQAGASATRVHRFDVKLTPNATVDSRLGRRSTDYWAPQWKGRIFGGFSAAAWSVGVTARYVGSYKDAGTSPRTLGRSIIYDVAGRIDVKKLGASLGTAKAATLSLGIVNFTDRLPEFSATTPYFDSSQADWRGRTLSARLSVDW